MSEKLDQLISSLDRQSYQALSNEQIEQQAKRRYESVYGQKRMSAQQAYEAGDAALARELGSLQASFDRQREESRARTESAYRQADRHALSRGMQRSSFNEATLANIGLAGDAEQASLSQEQSRQEADVQQRRTELSSQFSSQLKQLEADQQNDVLSYMDQLQAREYDRKVQSIHTANELSMKVYEYQHQLEQEAVEQARWEAEFEAKYG